jgi:hypothetical protein
MKIGEAVGLRQTGKRHFSLADLPRDHGGPGEKGSASMNQRERSEHQWATRPPLKLEITLLDLPRDLIRVDVQARVGIYQTMHRSVLVGVDVLGDIPLTVEADLYKWVAWLIGEQQERCKPEKKQRSSQRVRHPNWPSPAGQWRTVQNEEASGE